MPGAKKVSAPSMLPAARLTVLEPGCSGTTAKKLLAPSSAATTPLIETPELAGAWIDPLTSTLSPLMVAPLAGLAIVIAGALLMTVIDWVSCAPCGLVPDTVMVLEPECSGTSTALKALPTTVAGSPFTVMVALVAPEKVPVTVTLLSSMVAPLVGLVMVIVRLAKT